MQLLPISALTDNYIWLLHDGDGNALVVDPGESAPVETALASHGFRLRAVLLTHHHPDHTGGAAALRSRHGATIIGPRDARIDGIDRYVDDADDLEIDSPRASFRVMTVPGHTLSHVAYVGEGFLFSGDTLFSMGCGRLFEGTPAQMLHSLDRIASLPPATMVCCGHEYTLTNARFARTLDPDNPVLEKRLADVVALREQNHPTLPVALHTELQTNPFLRVDEPALVAWATQQGVVADERTARFAAIREAKDNFSA